MRNPQFYISDKRPIPLVTLREKRWTDFHEIYCVVRTQFGIFWVCYIQPLWNMIFFCFMDSCLLPTLHKQSGAWNFMKCSGYVGQDKIVQTVSGLTRLFQVPKTKHGGVSVRNITEKRDAWILMKFSREVGYDTMNNLEHFRILCVTFGYIFLCVSSWTVFCSNVLLVSQ